MLANYKDSSGASKSEELTLNTAEYIDNNTGVQTGNTYQIINTSNSYSKLYWGSGDDENKLIFEIPIRLPEQVGTNEITSFKLSVADMNREYIDEHAEQLDKEDKSKGIKYTLDQNNKTAAVNSYDKSGSNVIIPEYVKDTNGFRYKVTSIGLKAFNYCSGLTNVTIPDSVTIIGREAFASCTNLAEVTIPDSVTSIGIMAFTSCTSLAEVTIPDSVTAISNFAFYNCSGLTSVTIPDSVTRIGEKAFVNCTSLAKVTIKSQNIRTLYKDAFDNISSNAIFYVPVGKVDEYKTLLNKTNVQEISK